MEDEMGKLPFEYMEGLLKFLKRNEHIIEIITYDDLAWGNDYSSFESNNFIKKNNAHVKTFIYEKEFVNWNKRITKGKINKNKIYVLLQQDIDSNPDANMKVMNLQADLDIPSTFMLFMDRVDRKKIEQKGIVKITDYPLDFPKMQYLKKKNAFYFVIIRTPLKKDYLIEKNRWQYLKMMLND